MSGHSIFINHIAPEGSTCYICGKPASWQMYCRDCGHILRFYCDEHAYLSQGDEKLEKQIKKEYIKQVVPKNEKQIKKAREEWQIYLNSLK